MESLQESNPSAEFSLRQLSRPSVVPLWIFKGVLYYLSFIGPALLIFWARHWSIAALLAAAIMGYAFSGFVFLSLLILIKRLLIGPVQPTGWTTLESENGKRWCFAGLLTFIMIESCFRTMTSFISPL